MNKIEVQKTGLTVYEEILDNGLTVFVVPKKDVNNIYVTITTDFGSNTIEFVPNGKSDFVKVPLGIAHFLEHKMFEQEDGTDAFAFFGARGSDANANTNNFKTTYLFSGPHFFQDNMNFLLDYVQSPYFTERNVEKEKGIIIQEMKMYEDDPYSKLYDTILDCVFTEQPMKYPVIGTGDSVNSITKDDLYDCYNTFYHPTNMHVVVTGNVEAEEVINLIKENQKKKNFPNAKKILIKEYNEPDEVETKKKVITANITLPKVSIAYKINLDKIKNIPIRKKLLYLSILFDAKFGVTSLVNEEMRNEKILTEGIDVSAVNCDTHILYVLMGETNEEKKFLDKVQKEMKDLAITESELERKKKTLVSSLIYKSDSIMSINHKITNDFLRYKKVIDNNYEEIKSLNYEEFKKFVNELDVSNYSIVVEEKQGG